MESNHEFVIKQKQRLIGFYTLLALFFGSFESIRAAFIYNYDAALISALGLLALTLSYLAFRMNKISSDAALTGLVFGHGFFYLIILLDGIIYDISLLWLGFFPLVSILISPVRTVRLVQIFFILAPSLALIANLNNLINLYSFDQYLGIWAVSLGSTLAGCTLKAGINNATREIDNIHRQLNTEFSRLTGFIDHLGPDFMTFRHDIDGKLTWLKGNFEGITGVSVDKALGRPFSEIVNWDPASLAQMLEMVRKTLSEPQALTYLIRMQRRSDNRWITLELSSHPVMDKLGQVVAIEGILRDVTERAQRQRELELQTITLSSAKIATFVVDPVADNIIDANAAARLLLLGSEDKTLVGRSPNDFVVDPVKNEEFKEAVSRSKGDVITRMLKLKADTGVTLVVEMFSLLRIVDGAPKVYAFAVDRTERAKEEALRNRIFEQLEAASSATGLGIFEQNFESGEVKANKRLRLIYGLPLSIPLHLNNLTKLIHPEDMSRVYPYIFEYSSTSDGSNVDYRILVEGQTKWCRASVRYIKNAEDEVVSTVAVLDITAEKLRENELQLSLSTLHAVREKQAQMLSIVSHELRTPLSSSHMIYDQLNSTNLDHYLPVLKANNEIVLTIMDDLRMVIQPETVLVKQKSLDSPALLVERTMASLSNLAKQNGVVIHTSFDERAAEQYLFNSAALRQIVTNLAKNVFLHADASNVWVSATATQNDAASTELSVCIEDDGKGISKEFQQKMFEAFSRGETKGEGTGLGLYVINELKVLLDGEIAYFSSPKGGAGFKLTVKLESENEVADTNDSKYSEQVLTDTLAGKTILFAEDQLTIQMLSKNTLAKAGAEVTVASNGQLAMEGYSKASPDIVITDAMMPEMDGYELSARLRAEGYTGPIIAVTAATIGDERDRLKAAGADAVLSKPLNIDELKIALADWEQNRG